MGIWIQGCTLYTAAHPVRVRVRVRVRVTEGSRNSLLITLWTVAMAVAVAVAVAVVVAMAVAVIQCCCCYWRLSRYDFDGVYAWRYLARRAGATLPQHFSLLLCDFSFLYRYYCV
jgi:hypothetical protein